VQPAVTSPEVDSSIDKIDRAPARHTSGGISLAALLLAAFVVRLGWAMFSQVDVRHEFLYDSSSYDLFARHIIQGKGFTGYLGEPTAYFPPGYPAILGATYLIFGDKLVVAWALNAFLGALTCLVVYALAARLYSRRIGLWAAALLTFFPGQIAAAAVTMTEVAFSFLFTVAIALFVRWTDEDVPTRRWFGLGLLLGAASLVRGVALPFVVVPFACWLGLVGWRTAIRRTSVVVLGVALVVLPWTARNWIVMGSPILISGDGSAALFVAHNPLAQGAESFAFNGIVRKEWPWLAKLRQPEREATTLKLELMYGLRYMVTHPWHELTLIGPRLLMLYGGEDHGTPPKGFERVVGAVADPYYFVVLALAVIGLRGTLSDRRARVLPFTFAYFTLLHGVLFFGGPRFHAPLVPILTILAARVGRSAS